jgi:hypothetical protein
MFGILSRVVSRKLIYTKISRVIAFEALIARAFFTN